jgi:signal transduction histidine kinase
MLSAERFRPLWHYLEAEPWEDLIVAPVAYQDRPLGTITCYYLGDAPIDAAEVALVGAIADQAAITLINHELFQEAQGGAAIEERQRLARELHDSVSQALYGIALGARTARTLLDRDPSKVHEPLDYVLALADTGLREMRALIFELRPESLEQEGLMAAIEEHSQALARRHQFAVRLDIPHEPDLPLPEKEALYRIAQEALHNVAKHAHATNVDITLRTGAERVELLVSDDGRGFDPALQYAGHLGLHSMRERATRLGGGLEIESAPAQGTRVRAWLPIGFPR